MLTDVGALVLAYAGLRLGRKPGDSPRTFGYARPEVLAAFTNGIALLELISPTWNQLSSSRGRIVFT